MDSTKPSSTRTSRAAASKKFFIAYDFEIGGTLPDNLSRVSAKPPDGCIVRWPGSPEGRTQGSIWRTVVQAEIQNCDGLLAFVDLPNANVGFEVGYGLGLGKAVALGCVRPTPASWLTLPPLNGFLCPCLETPDAIRAEVRSADANWTQFTEAPTPGTGTLVLCPGKTGAAYLEMIPPEWGWRTASKSGWDLLGLPNLLDAIGQVIWIIAPHNDGPGGRDGSENAALSVIAGYAEAVRGIELRVLQAKNARGVADVIASRAEFSNTDDLGRSLEAIKTEWDARNTPRPPNGESRSVRLERPIIEPLPPDDWSDIPGRFIGRELQLNDVADALQGLLHRARTGQAPDGGRVVKVIWVHGFGGMGKSWFLHRSRLQAGADIRAVIIDWDSPTWRYPLTGEPRIANDIFDVIAYRLAQTCGASAAEPYWAAKDRVSTQGEVHRRLRDQFEGQLTFAAGLERVSSPMLRLLRDEGVWVDDLENRAKKLELWRRDPDRYQSSFVAWCHETARDADSAAIEPDRMLAEGLRESLRLTAQRHPLLLLLDTGEILSAELDRWLRRFLIPLARGESPLVALIGSRLAPDVALPAGTREGWQAELPRDRFRSIPFGELVRFTIDEIESALDKLARPVEGNHQELAESLHKITHGVPLAVRALLDLHEQRDDSLLTELAEADDDETLDEGEAVRNVVGTVARRMLYHLSQDRKPEREEDLRDIIALAVLQRADGEILSRLWPGQRIRDRLRDLGARYALLSGGDLHATVRDYLRRHWRDETERPAIFDDVVDAIERAIESLPSPRGGAASHETIGRRIMRLNLRTWRVGDHAVEDLARLLTVAMAYDDGIEDIRALLGELPLGGKHLAKARKLWKRSDTGSPDTKAIVDLLRGLCDRSKTWSDLERACLDLVHGVCTTERVMKVKDALFALPLLKSAFDHFGVDRMPRPGAVGEAFFSVATTLHPYWSKDARWVSQAEEAYLCAVPLGAREATCFNHLGWIYLDHLGRYEEAEWAFFKDIELDPKSDSAYAGLGRLYADHLARNEDAEWAFLRAIELEPTCDIAYDGLGWLYGELGRYEEAERAFLRAIELDPKSGSAYTGLGWLYRELGRYEEAERAFLRAIELDPKSGSGQGELALLCLLDKGDLSTAQRYSQEAMEQEPNLASTQVAAIAVTTWTKGWGASLPLAREWLPNCADWIVITYRKQFVALVRKVRDQGELPSLAEVLRTVEDRPSWKPWSEAVAALAAGIGP